MNTCLLPCLLAGAMLVGCGERQNSGASAETNEASSPLTAPVDYLGAVGKGQQTAIKTIDTAAINQAIQLFQAEHGRNPTSLDELVKTKFLARIPDAPHGMKIVYDANAGHAKVVRQ
ncbi:MAG TPA: hypothetical protein VEH04_04110 [Verrucomicrobiae bacterium]|nr:hypothetical protein [Verrucomicrobiae bacterium]